MSRHFQAIRALAGVKPPAKPKVYLAAPYSVYDSLVNATWPQVRFDLVNIAAMRLIRAGCIVFSPISHSHPISLTQPPEANTHGLWLEQDLEFAKWADILVVLRLPGVTASYGVNKERDWFNDMKKPVYFVYIDDIYDMELEEDNF